MHMQVEYGQKARQALRGQPRKGLTRRLTFATLHFQAPCRYPLSFSLNAFLTLRQYTLVTARGYTHCLPTLRECSLVGNRQQGRQDTRRLSELIRMISDVLLTRDLYLRLSRNGQEWSKYRIEELEFSSTSIQARIGQDGILPANQKP
jgi:hypothetical protein